MHPELYLSYALAPLAGVVLEALVPIWWLYSLRPFGLPWHPVVYIGAAIRSCARRLNTATSSERQLLVRGRFLIVAMAIASLMLGYIFFILFFDLGVAGVILLALCYTLLVSQRELHDRAAKVLTALDKGDIEKARYLLPALVGRDPDSLDEAGIRRAVLESLAENYSDGTVAPVFWGVLFGLPGLFFYKMVSTADSMIGYDNDSYRHFGRAAAKTDDFLNWLPARLTALLFLAGSPTKFSRNWHIVRRDAPQHRSRNAGWPEAAFATQIGVALAGPRRYEGKWTSDGFMNADANSAPSPSECQAGLRIYRRTCPLLWLLLFFSLWL